MRTRSTEINLKKLNLHSNFTHISRTNRYYLLQFITVKSLFIFVLSLMILLSSDLNAGTKQLQYAQQCDLEIGESVKPFKCSDGELVPKTTFQQNGETKCSDPEVLYNRCAKWSRLGRQQTQNKDVEIIWSCRKPDALASVNNDSNNTYHDIAIIQHNKKNGATCFYQKIGSTSGDGLDLDGDQIKHNIPAPNTKTGSNYWTSDINYCSKCHVNGPFIRTPHYANVKKNNKTILPAIADHQNYYLVANDEYKVYDLNIKTNCTSCHNIGAYAINGITHGVGKVNEVALGIYTGLPTSNGSYEFMPPKTNDSGTLEILPELRTGTHAVPSATLVDSIIPESSTYMTIHKGFFEYQAMKKCISQGIGIGAPGRISDCLTEMPGGSRIDAVFRDKNNKLMFFRDTQFVPFDLSNNKALDTAKTISPNTFKNLNWKRFDASFSYQNKAYLFKGQYFHTYNLNSNSLESNKALEISKGFNGVYSNHIDAAYMSTNNKAVLISDDNIYLYDLSTQKLVSGFPKTLNNFYKNLSFKKVNAAINIGNGKTALFNNEYYVIINNSTLSSDINQPLLTSKGWPGVAFSVQKAGQSLIAGQTIFQQKCQSCHKNSNIDPVASQTAPGRLAIREWLKRYQQKGYQGLINSTKSGFNNMPPMSSSLTDTQIKQVVTYLTGFQ